ncbi:MAG: endolytic transglycosylase MltG [Bacillota bacterium]|nr:endolytic transglycosylase MltG [Bacillota bacterium]
MGADLEKSREPRRRLWPWVLGVLGLLVLLFGLGAWWAWQEAAVRLAPLDPGNGSQVVVQIPPGASTQAIADLLYQKGIIKDPLVFRLYVRWKKEDGQLQAGWYGLSPSQDVASLVEMLRRGEVLQFTFTVPEGKTVADIREILLNFWPKEEVDEALRDTHWLKEPPPPDVKEPLEGYLFPETYRFPYGTPVEEAVGKMVQETYRRFTPEREARAKELGLSLHEVLTLASIIEKEARFPQDQPKISAVFHNRLKLNMKLQADPTVAYALGKPGDQLTTKDLQAEVPYNTYVYGGLPPGPIASPGDGAIEAALYPEDSQNLYFVSAPDGTTYYAKDYAAHLRNVQKVRQESRR